MTPPNAGPCIRRRLAKRIRILRAQHGWSQEALAEIAGLHRNYIGQVEREMVNVGVENLARLAAAFQVTMGELVDIQMPRERTD